ncbi:hypothetical protein FisN_30Hu119 [Fistulifera solaris]|uniref:Uncharacterized protein n=1 Tax=Fistulifera solaris TaxID=1519565 RepID=A0A1Z5K6R6_FISSO|nr:hypothetical protein FisN_30Hu119 [Fistulifera solaris]|eukprot:GAX21916.1 hypothetical protein FisN_30Hu119 [Fistulifera solaris]
METGTGHWASGIEIGQYQVLSTTLYSVQDGKMASMFLLIVSYAKCQRLAISHHQLEERRTKRERDVHDGCLLHTSCKD